MTCQKISYEMLNRFLGNKFVVCLINPGSCKRTLNKALEPNHHNLRANDILFGCVRSSRGNGYT